MLPSLTSAVYFFIFLFLCTWWSLCRTFDTLIFSCMCVLMAIFSAGHIIVLYLYQFQFFQESIPPKDGLIRSDATAGLKTHEVGAAPPAAQHTQLHTLNTLLLLILLLLKLNTFSAVDPTIQWPFSPRGYFLSSHARRCLTAPAA